MSLTTEALSNGHSLQNGHSVQNGHSLQNGHGGPVETLDYDSPLSTTGRVTSHDGIVGSWQQPTVRPNHLPTEDPDNLERWSPEVRASVIDFELHSRLGFRAISSTNVAELWHAELGAATSPALPGVTYQPLVTMERPSEDKLLEQLTFVASYADLRQDRMSEILAQLPGPMAFMSSIAFLHPDRTRWTIELIDAALRLAVFAEMRFKHALACRRPIEFSPQIQPMILTPGHGTLPSGHATEAFISALVFWELLRASGTVPYNNTIWGEQFMRLAARIAINRTVAGVHFPVDSAAGALLGLTLGQYFVSRCNYPLDGSDDPDASSYEAWKFEGSAYAGTSDFSWHEIYNTATPGQVGTAPYATSLGNQTIAGISQSPILKWLWGKALAEWT